VDTVCTNLNPPNVTRKTDFVVNGNGRGPGISPAGVFQPLSLQVYFNGQLDVSGSYIKKNVGKAEWSCNGQTTVPTPDGPAVIAFTALGNFHP